MSQKINDQQKWVYGGFLMFAVLIGYVSWAGLMELGGYFDWEAKIPRLPLVLQGVGLAIGAAVMLGLSLNKNTNAFMSETVNEVTKMTWPGQRETIQATIVVLIMVFICGVILGVFDWVFGTAMKVILGT